MKKFILTLLFLATVTAHAEVTWLTDLDAAKAQAAKERLLQEAAQELKRLRAEIERARQEKALFLGQVRALFEGYLEALKRLEKTP